MFHWIKCVICAFLVSNQHIPLMQTYGLNSDRCWVWASEFHRVIVLKSESIWYWWNIEASLFDDHRSLILPLQPKNNISMSNTMTSSTLVIHYWDVNFYENLNVLRKKFSGSTVVLNRISSRHRSIFSNILIESIDSKDTHTLMLSAFYMDWWFMFIY